MRGLQLGALLFLAALARGAPQKNTTGAIRSQYNVVGMSKMPALVFREQYTHLFEDYLERAARTLLSPPVKFSVSARSPQNALVLFDDAEGNKLDFIFADAALTACLEAEFRYSALVTQRVSLSGGGGNTYDLTEHGSVAFALQSRADIRSLRDVVNKTIAITSFEVLDPMIWTMESLKVSAWIDALQVRIAKAGTEASQRVIDDVLNGRADIGMVQGHVLASLDVVMRQRLSVISPNSPMTDGGKTFFPFATSSELWPEASLLAGPHVPWEVRREVLIALLRVDIAELERMHLMNRSTTNPGAITGPVSQNMVVTGFQQASSYDGARDTLVLMNRMMSNIPKRRWACKRNVDEYDAISCPQGSYKLSRQNMINGHCGTVPCPEGYICECRPCVRRNEDVEVVVVATHDHYDETENPELYEEKHLEAQFETCRKMQRCGILHQREELQYIIDDYLLRPEMQVRWRLRSALSEDRADVTDFLGEGNGYAMTDQDGAFQFKYGINVTTAAIGINILEVYLDQVQLPNSPFLLQCDRVPCEMASHIANETGFCNCNTAGGYTYMSGACVKVQVLVVAILVPAVGILLAVIVLISYYKIQKADSVWKIKFSDLIIADPPEVLGRGTFGLVVGGEYRTTHVAIKRPLPRASNAKKKSLIDAATMDGLSSKSAGLSSKNGFTGKSSTRSAAGMVSASSHASVDSDELPGVGGVGGGGGGGRDGNGDRSGKKVGFPGAKGENGFHSWSFRSEIAGGDYKGSARGGKGISKWGSGGANSNVDEDEEPNEGIRTLAPSVHARRDFLSVLMPCWFSEDTASRNAFIEEMRLLSKLRHPCITTVMGAVMDSDYEPLLIMERMEHGSLYDLAHNHTMLFEGDVIVPMVRHIAQGLSFIHSFDPPMVHGDLKAANVLVDSQFRAKIADFGLTVGRRKGFIESAGMLASKQKHESHGTLYWMAPELLNNETPSTLQSDMYAFGVTLWEVYARADPFDGEKTREVIDQVKDRNREADKRPLMPADCPQEIRVLIEQCWHRDPSSRPEAHEVDRTLKALDMSKLSASGVKGKGSVGVLHDIFPRHIADKLVNNEKVDPEHRDSVTIFFSDIVSFTDIAAKLDPQKVSDMLDRLYTEFDRLSREHNVFKVETIGDAYMAVTNLVEEQENDHAVRIAEFALRAIQVARETAIDVDQPELGTLHIRVGFHSGPVVASVVGTRSPRYCLFGDTVNTSSRMESNSKQDRVHCSEQAAKILTDQLEHRKEHNIEVIPRGPISIKGKGTMHTFWVESLDRHVTQSTLECDTPSPHISVSRDAAKLNIPEATNGMHMTAASAHGAEGGGGGGGGGVPGDLGMAAPAQLQGSKVQEEEGQQDDDQDVSGVGTHSCVDERVGASTGIQLDDIQVQDAGGLQDPMQEIDEIQVSDVA